MFRPQHKNNLINNESLVFGNESIAEKKWVKFLGLIIDQNLHWSQHFKHLISKLSRANYMLNSVKHVLPTYCMKMLYYSLYQSHLNYGIILWGTNMSKRNLKKIVVSQKRAIRAVKRTTYNAHTDPLFTDLKILKLHDLTDLEIFKIMYLNSKGKLPSQVCSLFTSNPNQHTYFTRHRNEPAIKPYKYAAWHDSVFCRGPVLWSSLQKSLKDAVSVGSFTRQIKKQRFHLF